MLRYWWNTSSHAMVAVAAVASLVGHLAQAEESKILVHIPFGLHNPDGFAHVKADFGFPTVSPPKSLSAFVYFIEETLCAAVSNQTKGYPTHDTWHTPFILLINGGGICSAVTKVRHAQMIGASAVLLSDPTCDCSNKNCTAKYSEASDTCHSTDPVLVNDGSGADISIPSFRIEKSIGEDLKTTLKNQKPCLVEMQWGIRENNITYNHPKVQFWTSAFDPLVSLESYMDMKTVLYGFANDIDFVPRFAVFDGERFGCNDDSPTSSDCDHLCTNHGRYCMVHGKDLSGAAIIKETLRRLCIWTHYSNRYWDYLLDHKQECGADPFKFADPKCIEASLRVAQMDADKINACMTDGGGLDDVSNAMLDAALSQTATSGVVSLPAVTVNHKGLGWTSARALFETVCTEYWFSGIDHIPAVCEKCLACPDSVGCLKVGHCVDFKNEERHPDTGSHHKNDQKRKGGGGWKVFWSLVLIGGLGAAGFYVYKNHYLEGQATYRRSNLMSDYMHLSSDE